MITVLSPKVAVAAKQYSDTPSTKSILGVVSCPVSASGSETYADNRSLQFVP